MEQLWGLLLSMFGSLWSGVQDQQRYENELDFRKDVFETNQPEERFKKLKGLGATDAFALQGAAGMSNVQYGGSAYNSPYDFGNLGKTMMSDLVSGKKAPSEIRKNDAEATKLEVETEYYPRIASKQIDLMEKQVYEMEKRGDLNDAQTKSVLSLIEPTKNKVLAETAVLSKKLVNMDTENEMMLSQIDLLLEQSETERRKQNNVDADTMLKESQRDLNNEMTVKTTKEIGNIILQRKQIQEMTRNLSADTNYKITQTALNQALNDETQVLTLESWLRCVEQDYKNFLTENGYSPELYTSKSKSDSGGMNNAYLGWNKSESEQTQTNESTRNINAINKLKDYKNKSEIRKKANSTFNSIIEKQKPK